MKTNDHVFAAVPSVNIPRSKFRRNFNLLTTIDVNYLYPIYVDECLPGDTFICRQHLFGRLSTPLTPIMDNLYLDTFYFAVPVRLVDSTFKRLMGERPFGDVRNDYTVPMLKTTSDEDCPVGSLSDYLGVPPLVDGLEFCPWWHRAYNLVWNEWFRDENLQAAVPVAGVHEDGTVTTEAISDYNLLKRGKRHDYFTSCLPWPCKGDPVQVGLTKGFAPVGLSDGTDFWHVGAGINRLNYTPSESATLNLGTTGYLDAYTSGALHTPFTYKGSKSGTVEKSIAYETTGMYLDGAPMFTDLNGAYELTINNLREAFAIQRLLETDARGGTRYIELLYAHFQVRSPDARLQRPEYLGGCSVPLNVNVVPSTADTGMGTPQAAVSVGTLGSFVTGNSDCTWCKSFTEHTLIIGLANIRADLSYSQGLPRMFSRKTKYDFYWPELANLGEQAVLNKEIYAQGTEDDDQPFGYQERWAEYRYHPNMVTGLFRPWVPTNLSYWHLSQSFDNLPVLNDEFIEENVPIDRVVTVADEPAFILSGWFELDCVRPMPLYSIPGLGGRL